MGKVLKADDEIGVTVFLIQLKVAKYVSGIYDKFLIFDICQIKCNLWLLAVI